jgi:hypothetical protein
MNEENSNGFNSISGSAGPENSKSVNARTRKKIIAQEEIHLMPQDRVEVSRETPENQAINPYKMTNNPDLNRYIETLNQVQIFFKVKNPDVNSFFFPK